MNTPKGLASQAGALLRQIEENTNLPADVRGWARDAKNLAWSIMNWSDMDCYDASWKD